MVESRVRWRLAVGSIALVLATALDSSAAPAQAPRGQAPRPAPPAPAGTLRVNVSQVPTPEKGKPYAVSLCSGQVVPPGTVAGPCRAADAANTVGGAAQSSVIQFKLQNGSSLPAGFHLDGFGVITGTSNADLRKVTVKVCAFQLGGFGSNYNCQGQTIGFAGGKAVVLGNKLPNAQVAAPGHSLTKSLVVASGLTAGTVGVLTMIHGAAGPDCTSQKTEMDSQMASMLNAVNAIGQCTTVTCINSRRATLDSAASSALNAAGSYCVCLGGTKASAADVAQLQSLFSQLSAFGVNPGSYPSCFR